MRPLLLTCVALLFAVTGVHAAEGPTTVPQAEPLSATLTAEVDGPLVAGFPVQFKLTVANVGTRPFHYWCGGPAHYPSARPFSVKVTDSRGTGRVLRLSNGQYEVGSGIDQPITTTRELPAACEPLAAGTYTLNITGISQGYRLQGKVIETWPAMSAEPITVTIKEDAAALAEAEWALLARVQKEPFAKHVAQVWGIDPVVRTWLEELAGNGVQTALEAAGRLQRVDRLPAGGEEFLMGAADKHDHPDADKSEKALVKTISLIARNVNTDAALDVVVKIATGHSDDDVREQAASDLRDFPQEKAEETMMALLKEKGSPPYWKAVAGLANRHNPVALAPLLGIANDPLPARRNFAISCLGLFRDLPEARAALTAALDDTDPMVRASATRAMEDSKTP